MSDFTIRDGRGTGSHVEVDLSGRLQTTAYSVTQSAERALTGNQFVIPVGVRVITTTDTEHAILRLNPTSPTRQFFVQRFFISVRDTTPVIFRLYVGSSAPSANNVAFTPGNANTLSAITPSLDAEVWDGVGTGMTVSSLGTQAFAAYFAQGATDVPIDGGQAWGLNSAILVTAECAATNRIAAVITGWEETI
jgi:hypothetical protein